MKNNNTLIWIILAICIVLLLGFFRFAGWRDYGMIGMMGGNYGYGMMFFGWITWVLVIVFLIAGIYWLINNANKK